MIEQPIVIEFLDVIHQAQGVPFAERALLKQVSSNLAHLQPEAETLRENLQHCNVKGWIDFYNHPISGKSWFLTPAGHAIRKR